MPVFKENNILMKILSYIIVGFLLLSCTSQSKDHNHEEHDHEHEVHDHDATEEHHDEHEQEHDHGQEQVTFFSDALEVFAEYNHPVIGETLEIRLHITRLENYKPFSSGKVEVNFQGTQVEAVSTTPGIFSFTLQPNKAGTAVLAFKVYDDRGVATAFTIEEVIAGDHSDLHTTEHDEHDELEKGSGITFLKEQAWNMEFRIQKVLKGSFSEVIHTSGQILPANEDEKIVTSLHAGLVSLKDALIEGNYIKSNDILLELSGKGLAEDNMLVHEVELKSNYELASSNYKRLSELSKDKIVSERELLEAKAQYEQSRAAYENFGYQTMGDYYNIKASSAGYIKNVYVKNGQYVEVGAPLFSITQNKRLILQADVSQKYWTSLPFIKSANIKIPNSQRVYTTKELSGDKISYGKSANQSSWSTPVFFTLKNQGELIPGTYVEVYLETKSKPSAIAVPLSALIEEQGNLFVIVQKGGETYEKRPVTTGANNGREIEVLSGLAEGEMIVTQGAYQVKLASLSSAIPAHNHQH